MADSITVLQYSILQCDHYQCFTNQVLGSKGEYRYPELDCIDNKVLKKTFENNQDYLKHLKVGEETESQDDFKGWD